jgi:hypothetical protein
MRRQPIHYTIQGLPYMILLIECVTRQLPKRLCYQGLALKYTFQRKEQDTSNLLSFHTYDPLQLYQLDHQWMYVFCCFHLKSTKLIHIFINL